MVRPSTWPSTSPPVLGADKILKRDIANNTKVEYVAAEQKFSDLTNRVEMLETELIAMKLCKLKMEADKTEAELQVKQMEKTLHAIQNGHSSQVEHPTPMC